MLQNHPIDYVQSWRRLIFLVALFHLAFVGCGGNITIPLPVPTLKVTVDGKLPGQVISASKGLTAVGTVKLAAGTYKLNETLVKISEGTTVDLSGLHVGFEPLGQNTIQVIPSDFVIVFSKPISVANVAIKELKRDSNPVEIQVDLYESIRNLIATAVTDAASVPLQPSESIVSAVTIDSANVQMRPDATLRLGGLNMHLAVDSSGKGTSVEIKDTTAAFGGKAGLTRGNGTIDLRLLCTIDGSHVEKIGVTATAVEVSGSAGWNWKDNNYSATTERPLLITAELMSVDNGSTSLKLTPSQGNVRFRFVANGDWTSESYNADLQIEGTFIEASAVVAGGNLKFAGNAEGLLAVSRKGRIESVKTIQPSDKIVVAYSKELNNDRTLSIKSRLPRFEVNYEQQSKSLGILFADLVAEATEISIIGKGVDIVTIKCGNTQLTASGSNFSGKIQSIAIKLSSGAIAEFSDVMIDALSEKGTGTVSCVLQKSALPEALRQELGGASLTAKKIVIKVEEWKPTSVDFQNFEATTSLAAVEQKARESLEKKHAVEIKDEYVSIDSADVKLTSFTLSEAKDATHIHLKGTVCVDGKVKVRSDDVQSDLGKAVKIVVDAAVEEAEKARKALEEKERLAAVALQKANDELKRKEEQARQAIEEAAKEKAREAAIEAEKVRKAAEEAAKKTKEDLRKAEEKLRETFKKAGRKFKVGAILLPWNVAFAAIFADVTLLETDVSITPEIELDCDLKLIVNRDTSLQKVAVSLKAENVRVKIISTYSDIIRKTLFEALVKADGLEKVCVDAISKAKEVQPFQSNEKLAKVHVQAVSVSSVADKLLVTGSLSLILD